MASWLSWKTAQVEDRTEKLIAVTFEKKIDNFINLNKSISSKFLGYELVLKFCTIPLNTVVHITVHREDVSELSELQCDLNLLDCDKKERFAISKLVIMDSGKNEDQVKILRLNHLSNDLNPLRSKNTDVYFPKGTFTIHCRFSEEKMIVPRDEATQTDALNIEEPSAIMFLKTLSKDLAKFYDDQTHSDCVLKVGKTKFPVHRAVLSSRSTVFAAMFCHDTSESRSGEVNIPDVEATILDTVLYYIYSSEIRGLAVDTAIPMYVAADKYALLELRVACLKFLLVNLTVENICDAANLAHMHGEVELKNRVVEFIEEKLGEIVESDRWKQFLKEKSFLANKLLCTALLRVKKSNNG